MAKNVYLCNLLKILYIELVIAKGYHILNFETGSNIIYETIDLIDKMEEDSAPIIWDMAIFYEAANACRDYDSDRNDGHLYNYCSYNLRQLDAKQLELSKKFGGLLPDIQDQMNSSAEKLGMSILKQTARFDINDIYKSARLKERLNDLSAICSFSKRMTNLLGELETDRNVPVLDVILTRKIHH